MADMFSLLLLFYTSFEVHSGLVLSQNYWMIRDFFSIFLIYFLIKSTDRQEWWYTLALRVSGLSNSLAYFPYCSVFWGMRFCRFSLLFWLIQNHPSLYVWNKPLISQSFCTTRYIQLRVSQGCEWKHTLAVKLKELLF